MRLDFSLNYVRSSIIEFSAILRSSTVLIVQLPVRVVAGDRYYLLFLLGVLRN